ncbi:unnamed protein product [Toxocara canis]|uniref:Tnp_DDE_dom domain-containing protein n=1 Tax=Toxocara canis TaxID=6265 RepID=A0A183UGZ8_TOXCA|nr:unnamed protein product [Toxocara canis]
MRNKCANAYDNASQLPAITKLEESERLVGWDTTWKQYFRGKGKRTLTITTTLQQTVVRHHHLENGVLERRFYEVNGEAVHECVKFNNRARKRREEFAAERENVRPSPISNLTT